MWNEWITEGRLGSFTREHLKLIRQKDPGKQYILGEIGILDGKNKNDQQINVYNFWYGVSMADAAIQMISGGMSGFIAWDLDDSMHFVHDGGESMNALSDKLPPNAYDRRKIWGVQFHPEVTHTPQGQVIIGRFVHDVCGCPGDWTPGNIVADAIGQVREQVGGLIYPGFVAATPLRRLPHLARYIHAAQLRLEKLPGNVQRERKNAALVARYQQRYRQAAATHQQQAGLAELRWMIEELRVSLFAQELGTAEKVSPERLDRLWAQLSGD